MSERAPIGDTRFLNRSISLDGPVESGVGMGGGGEKRRENISSRTVFFMY